jgi:hypothetical protein
MRTTARSSTILLTCLLVLAPAVGADAKGKKKPKKVKAPVVVQASSSSTTRGDNVTALATCPKGMIATGGGWVTSVVAGATGSSSHAVWESKRAGIAAWTVSALRDDTDNTGAPLPLTAAATCRSALVKKKGKVKAAAKKKKKRKPLNVTEASGIATVAGGGNATGTATATCPKGRNAVGGGFSSSPPASGFGATTSLPLFWQSRSSGSSAWLASAANVSMAARTITSYAYCAAGVNVAETSATAPIAASLTANNLQKATATTQACPKKTHPSAGGFDNPPINFPATAAPLMIETVPAGKSWRGGAANISQTAGSIAVKGYCF